MLFKSALALILASSFSVLREESLYNDSKVIYHAIDPDVGTDLEGIDPGYSIEVMEWLLNKYAAQKCVAEETRGHIESLEAAKRRYYICIELVQSRDESKAREVASELSKEVENSLLFVGGHYLYTKSGALIGHTATYEVERQENGRLSFAVNNTMQDSHHEIDGDTIKQLVYVDLEPTDLDASFWENVIKTNYMNLKEEKRMSSFYAYLDTKLLKEPSNKIAGRSYRMQKAGVCGWKAIAVWLDGKMGDERSFHKFMFETLLANFHPDDQQEPLSIFLKKGLMAKIEELKR